MSAPSRTIVAGSRRRRPTSRSKSRAAASRSRSSPADRRGAGRCRRIASEPLPAGAVVPALDRRRTSPDPAVVADALERALERAGLGVAAPRRARRARQRRARVAAAVRAAARPRERISISSSAGSCARPRRFRSTTRRSATSRASARRRGRDARGRRRAARRRSRSTRPSPTPLGIHAGIVDLASFNVMNAVIGAGAAPAGDWLLVCLAPEATTLAILRGDAPDVLPPPRGRRRRAAQRARASDGDVSRGSAGRDAVRARLAVRRGARAAAPRDARREIARSAWRAGRSRRRAAGGGAARASVSRSPDVLDALAAPVGVLLRERRAA